MISFSIAVSAADVAGAGLALVLGVLLFVAGLRFVLS